MPSCRVESLVITFGVPYAGVFLRAPTLSAQERYEAVLLSTGQVQIRKLIGGRTVVLGEASSGLASLSSSAKLSLTATGAGPVTLVAAVNGVIRLSSEDTVETLAASGFSGLTTNRAGVPYDQYRLWSEASSPPPPNSTSLGAAWVAVQGVWYTDGRRAISDRNPAQASAILAPCADCRVEAIATGFGVSETGLYLRAPSGSSRDRYDMVLRNDGRVEIRRSRSGVTTVLGSAASGLALLNEPSTLSLQVTGAAPVTLTAFVNGVVKLTVTDSSASALVQAGYSGMLTSNAGVWFDSYRLYSLLPASPPLPEAGSPPPPNSGERADRVLGAADRRAGAQGKGYQLLKPLRSQCAALDPADLVSSFLSTAGSPRSWRKPRHTMACRAMSSRPQLPIAKVALGAGAPGVSMPPGQ